jgi:hypothetical protein
MFITCLLLFVVHRAGLTYAWAVFKDGSQDYTIKSTSKQFDTFTLDPYTLSVNSLWTFKLTVIDTKTTLSSVDIISVNVVRGNIVAVITGGATTAVLFGGTLTLDASNSVDLDKAG